ncbi:MAG: S-formylglutathione hydrolase [Pseudomonadota bacterium]
MKLVPVSSWASFGGTLGVYDHESAVTNCTMRFAVFAPPQVNHGPVPVLWYLSGLTCTWANVMEKSGIQKHAAEHGLMIVAPDTSPRGEAVANDDAYDLGQGAGFYLTATTTPWARHYKMDQYITDELPGLISGNFPADMSAQGITGHSMGGHGAITLHLKNPSVYKTCSAFSPIVSPSRVPWGQKALTAYLGDLSVAWEAYDATELVKEMPSEAEILIDQGAADQFLNEQLDPELFLKEGRNHGQRVKHRLQPGYDHSYYFVASFIEDHVAWHSKGLKG